MELSPEDRRIVSLDIARIEFGWLVGMPVCKHLQGDLWEVRSMLPNRRIVRVLFSPQNGRAVLLHAFFKKTQQAPKKDIDLAIARMKQLQEDL